MAAIPSHRFECSFSKIPFSSTIGDGSGGRRITGPSYLGMKVSDESRRFRGLRAVNAASGDGAGGGQINRKNNGGSGGGGGGGDGGGKRGDPFESLKWICGSIGLVAVPLWRRIKNAGDSLEEIDVVVEKVESFADKIGNAARNVAKDLPDGQMKLVALKILKVADNIEDSAGVIDDVLDKITDTLNGTNDSHSEDENKEKKENQPNQATLEAKK